MLSLKTPNFYWYKLGTHVLFLLCILFFSSATLHSQQTIRIDGTVFTADNNPLAFATIQVRNLKISTTSDAQGKYSLRVPEGTHLLTVSYLGYISQSKRINTVGQDNKTVDFYMQAEIKELKTVEIYSDSRNKAKEIMQKARAQRENYNQAVMSYSCSTYLKSSIEHRPFVSDKIKDNVIEQKDSGEVEVKQKNQRLASENALLEYLSLTYFKQPDKIREKFIAYNEHKFEKSSFSRGVSVDYSLNSREFGPPAEENNNPYMLFKDMNSSGLNFYSNLISFPAISTKPLMSPLATTSYLHYKFDYEGISTRFEKPCHIIKVSPFSRTEALFEGTIYIEDSSFALVYADLSIHPSNLNFCNSFHLTQEYKQAEPNKYLPTQRGLQYQIALGKDTLLGEVSINHFEYRVNPEIEAKIFTGEIKKFELSAFDKDTNFWNTYRPVPLKPNEKVYINTQDSLRNYYESPEYLAKIDSQFNKINIWNTLYGVGHRNRLRGTEWYIGGIFEQMNFFGIGGYRHRLPGYFYKTLANKNRLEFRGFVDYGFTNKDVKGKLGIGYNYSRKRFMRTFVEVGDFYSQINNFASLQQAFSRSNYARNITFHITQRLEIVNGLFAEFGFDYGDQSPINNLQLEKWSGDLFGKINTPVEFERYIKSEFHLRFSYSHKQLYYFKNNRKVIVGTKYPKLVVNYRKGIPSLFKSEVNFDYLELNVYDNKKIARWGTLRWDAMVGNFYNSKSLRLLEHKYFRGSDPFFFSDPLVSFQLLGPTLNTNKDFYKLSGIHHFEGAITDKIPYFNRLKLHLAGGAGLLSIPSIQFHHAEMFFGFERNFRIKEQIFRIGAYAVSAANTKQDAYWTYKFGISFFDPFTGKFDY
jgi:hypothetical protein